MPVTIEESIKSRTMRETLEGISFQRVFICKGTDQTEDLVDLGPQKYETYADLEGIVVISREAKVLVVGGGNGGVCELTVNYGRASTAPKQEDGREEEFSTIAQTEHIERAISQTHFPSSQDMGQLIGMKGNDVEGVDIYFPKGALNFSVEHLSISNSYRAQVYNLTGKVNASGFEGFAAGEVLFLGMVARRRGFGAWRAEYRFLIEPNLTFAVETVSGSQNVSKNGWDYVWYSLVKQTNTGQTALETKIAGAHVAQVYNTGDFGLLRI